VSEKIYPAGPGYDAFKKGITKLTGVDLEMYKYQIHRRVHTLMRNWGMKDYDEYYDVIKRDPEKRRAFLDYITINVTEFFRNPERWKVLREQVFPSFIEAGISCVNIWSAGCSSGQEPYSLAILALELKLPCEVLAIDVDEGALAKARRGIYPTSQLEKISPEMLSAYFRPVGEGMYQVTGEVRNKVTFKQFNLLKDPFPENQHLILCRNVVIYFSAETKKELYGKFFRSLAPGGFLMVGSTEQIFGYRSIGFDTVSSFVYMKPSKSEIDGSVKPGDPGKYGGF